MPTFAIIENSIVQNIIVADTQEMAQEATGKTCVEYTETNPAIIGLGWDGTTFEQLPVPEYISPEDNPMQPDVQTV